LEDIRQFKIKDARLIEERNRFFIISIVSSSLLIILGILLYFIRKNRKQLIITTQLNQHLSFLLSTLSHDIRSPLVSLFYMNNKEHTEQTIRTTKQLKKIIAMVDDLLHWSSSNLNLITTHKVKIDLLEIIDEWNEFFKEDLKAKNLTLQLNAPKPLIYFDMQILQLILRNTLTNAIKYSKSDQEIEINLNYTDFNEGCLRILNTIDTEATHHTIPSKGLGLKLIIPLLKKEKIELTH
jgi:signal transduction histidine kinase